MTIDKILFLDLIVQVFHFPPSLIIHSLLWQEAMEREIVLGSHTHFRFTLATLSSANFLAAQDFHVSSICWNINTICGFVVCVMEKVKSVNTKCLEASH